jgi:hypothetical protein
MILHRVGVAAADTHAWAGYPDLACLLEGLNANRPPRGAHDLGSPGNEQPELALPPGANPRTLRSCFGTILYADLKTGRVRHGPDASVPRNLFLVPTGDTALLTRACDDGKHVSVRMRPEGPRASKDGWTPWAGGGLARTFAMVTTGATVTTEDHASKTFALRAAGLFLCAEANGELTLSRTEPGEWEQFSFEPDDA